MTVETKIKRYWPTTDRELVAKEPEYPGARSEVPQGILNRLYKQHAPLVPAIEIPQAADVEDEDLQQYLAAASVLSLLPMARDYFKEQMLSESGSVDNGGGSGSVSYINKLTAMDELEETLENDVLLYQGAAILSIRPLEPVVEQSQGDIPTVRTNRSNLINPADRARMRGHI